MTHHRFALAMIGISIFVVCGQWPGQATAQVHVDVGGVHVHVGDHPAPPPPEGLDVLTRGPVHEAFAQPVVLDETAPFTITRQPPPPLDEVVPDQKPEGNNIVWIPGYWSWDTDRNDFIWVSGCWRAVPPNMGWVPGYWAQTRGGYQWVAGFWTTAGTEALDYLPAPPASLEEGPQGSGSPDSVWIPGCWVPNAGRYAWRPGFWEPARPNWVWVPSQYFYTPHGYVFVDGYWDYSIDRRGVAFSPIYCPANVYGQAGFQYSPDIALNIGGLLLNLFACPGRSSYYFGDYYGAQYSRAGFYPWCDADEHHGWYDPIFVHQRWQHRDDHQWVQHQREGYNHRRDDTALRPARTYSAMQTQVARLPEKDRAQAQLARPMNEVVAAKITPFKFAPVDAKTREATAIQAKDVHAYKDTRAQWESPAAAPKEITAPKEVVAPKEGVAPKEVVTPKEPVRTPPSELPKPPVVVPPEKAPDHGAGTVGQPRGEAQPQKVTIPKPPVAVREPVTDKELTPPPRPEHPKPDSSVQPRAPKADTPKADTPKADTPKDKGAPDKPDSPK